MSWIKRFGFGGGEKGAPELPPQQKYEAPKKQLRSFEDPERLKISEQEMNEMRREMNEAGIIQRFESGNDFCEIDAATAASSEHPERNEDRVFVFADKENRFAAVAVMDGVGGSQDGEKASNAFQEQIREQMEIISEQKGEVSKDIILKKLYEAGMNAHRELGNYHNDAPDTTMTFAVAIPRKDGKYDAYFAQAGDSRGYILNNGKFEQVTKDDSPVQEMMDRGEIDEMQAKIHPRRNFIRHSARSRLEGSDFPFTVEHRVLEPGAVILLGSDGFTDQIHQAKELPELQEFMANDEYGAPSYVVRSRVREGQGIRDLSKTDDVSVVRMQLRMGKKIGAEAPQEEKIGKSEFPKPLRLALARIKLARSVDQVREIIDDYNGNRPESININENHIQEFRTMELEGKKIHLSIDVLDKEYPDLSIRVEGPSVKDSVEKKRKQGLKVGDEVKVRRSNGQIQDGWHISRVFDGFGEYEGKKIATLRSDREGGIVRDELLEELEELNK